jgi:hypothetical protein
MAAELRFQQFGEEEPNKAREVGQSSQSNTTSLPRLGWRREVVLRSKQLVFDLNASVLSKLLLILPMDDVVERGAID